MDFPAPSAPAHPRPAPSTPGRGRVIGLLLCAAVGLASIGISMAWPGLSPMLVAILAGVVLRNTVRIPAGLEPGIDVAAKTLLRAGVALLGLQIALPSILKLGPGVLIIVVCAVGGTFGLTLLLGKWMGVDDDLRILIAAGFSICGAAAVAGIQGTIQASRDKVAAAVSLVVLFGTLMIPALPGVIALFGLGTGDAGTLIGGTTHEVAQVVATAGIVGGTTLMTVAVTVKLARVALMAVVVAGVALSRNRHRDAAPGPRPPVLPLFLVGFIAMMLIATTGLVPAPVLAGAKVLQQFLLATAMFALGLGVHIKTLLGLGARPLLLGLCSTAIILAIVGCGIALGAGAVA